MGINGFQDKERSPWFVQNVIFTRGMMEGKKMRESFIIYKSFYSPISKMTDEKFGALWRAIFEYQLGNTPVIDDNEVKMAFSFFKNQFRIDDDKYMEICKKRSSLASLGGKAKAAKAANWQKKVPKLPKGAKAALNEHVHVHEHEEIHEIHEEKKRNIHDMNHVYEEKKRKKSFNENVYLTDDEYLNLQTKHGIDITQKCIEKLSSYKLANGKKYKSDYGAINSWVLEAINENKSTAKKTRGELNNERARDFLKREGIIDDISDCNAIVQPVPSRF